MYFFFKLICLLNYKMNNQTMFMLGGLAALVVILAFLFMPSMETYTKAKLFSNGDHFLTMDKKGEIVLQPVSDVDDAIDIAAASIAADRDTILKGYQPKGNYQPAGSYQPKGNYQPAGNYLIRGKFYRIWNKEGGQNVLRWGDQIKADGNKNAKNQYRYFKIDN